MSETILTASELPAGFEYPSDFIRFVTMEIIYLEPWFVLTDERLRERHQGLKNRYPNRRLVPLARREDNDDVACWDLSTGKISIVHDFAAPGWESRGDRGFPDFAAWLHSAIDDMLEFR